MKANKHLWLPAGLGILYILFISMFALDAFSGDASLIEKIGGVSYTFGTVVCFADHSCDLMEKTCSRRCFVYSS